MVDLSIVIPFKNDFGEIDGVLTYLFAGIPINNTEIIIVNDGSVHGSGKFCPLELNFPNVRVINNHTSFGVGYSFDRGVAEAQGDVIVLMGADVYPRIGWYDKVVDAVKSDPNTLGCSTCIGLNPTRMNIDDEKNFRRYGADLLFTVGEDDLPLYSTLRNRRGGYSDLFKAKWMHTRLNEEPYEIPCILGAFYFTSKSYYNFIGGWDTQKGNRHRGHISWGHLEPYISLKSWLVGGGCTLYPSIESGHVFARVTKENRFSKGVRSAEWIWRNALFILETQILDEGLRQKLYNFIKAELNLGLAKRMITQHYEDVLEVREKNRILFKNTPNIFAVKFGYSIKYEK